MRITVRTTVNVIAALTATAALLGCGQQAPEPEPLTERLEQLMPEQPEVPDLYRPGLPGSVVVWGDDDVVAATLELAPGYTTPTLDEPIGRTLLYALDGGTITLHREGGERSVELAAGEALELEPGLLALEDPGESPQRMLLVTRTGAEPAGEPQELGPAPADAGRVLVASDEARAVELSVAPQATVALEGSPIRVVFAPRGASLQVVPDDGGRRLELAAEQAAGVGGAAVALRNVGEDEATVILLEFAR